VICELPEPEISAAEPSIFGFNKQAEFKKTAENAGRRSSKTILFKNNRFRVFLRRITRTFLI
jgi:hypothetical protein